MSAAVLKYTSSGQRKEETRNSFNHLPELFKGQNYFWIITNPVLKKNKTKKQLNNTKKDIHVGGSLWLLGHAIPWCYITMAKVLC